MSGIVFDAAAILSQNITGSGTPQTVTTSAGSVVPNEYCVLNDGAPETVLITAVTYSGNQIASMTGTFANNHSSGTYCVGYVSKVGIDFSKQVFYTAPIQLGSMLNANGTYGITTYPLLGFLNNSGTQEYPLEATSGDQLIVNAPGSGGINLATNSGPLQYNGNTALVEPCSVSLSNGGSAIAAATYTTPLNGKCLNIYPVTYTITKIQCYSDNSGSSTANVADSNSNALLTGAITASPSWVSGTQSAHTTIAAGVWTNWTIVADGTSKVINCVMTTTR